MCSSDLPIPPTTTPPHTHLAKMMATRATSQITAAKAAFAGKAVRGSVTTRAAVVSTKVTCAAKSWMPGSKHPAHLDGSLVGDFGFDPLGLGKKPEDLAWYVQAELVHARFAMLGAAGVLIPEALTKMGVLNVPVWYEAGAMELSFTNTITLATRPLLPLLALLHVVVQDIPEAFPANLRDKNRVAEVPLHLGDGHVAALLVALDVEVEVLVLDPAVAALGQLALEAAVIRPELVCQVCESVPELDKSLGWDGDLRPGTPPGDGLADPQEPAPEIGRAHV